MATARIVARSWDKAQVLTALFLASAWVAVALELARASRRLDAWIVGDWLINYAGGFVRRGLPGEAIRLLWKATGVAPPAWVLGLQLVLYAVFFLSAFRLLRSRLTDWGFLLATLSPAVFSFWVLDHQGAGRKEILYFAVLATYGVMLKRDSGLLRSDLRHGLLLSAGLTVLVLSHEMLFLFSPFLLTLLLVSRQEGAREMPRFALRALVAPALAVAFSVGFPGNASVAARICRSLRRYAPDECQGASAIGYLARNAGNAMGDVAKEIRDHGLVSTYVIALLLGAVPFCLILLSWKPWERLPALLRSRLDVQVFLVALAAPLPAFAVGYDWGRFLNMYFVSVLIVFCAWTDRRARMGQATAAAVGAVMKDPPAPRRWDRGVAALLALAYVTCWSMPHSGGPVGSGFLPTVGRGLARIAAAVAGRE